MLLSVDQFAEKVGVHASTLRRWLRAGMNIPKPLPVKAIGGGPLWRERDIDDWKAAQIRGGTLPAAEFEERPRLALVR